MPNKSAVIKVKPLAISLLISLGVGALSGFLTQNSMGEYNKLIKPALSPPSIVFPIVWTILFALTGISAYLVFMSDSKYKDTALKIYATQLIVNFFWSIIFFNLQKPLFAFVWLLLLITLVIVMIICFYKVNRWAAYLQLPYLVWLLFAGYLNLMIYLLNR